MARDTDKSSLTRTTPLFFDTCALPASDYFAKKAARDTANMTILEWAVGTEGMDAPCASSEREGVGCKD